MTRGQLQVAWDALHDALLFPRSMVRLRQSRSYHELGRMIDGCKVLTNQLHVPLRDWAVAPDAMTQLAEALTYYEPLSFGWLPTLTLPYDYAAVNCWSTVSPIRLRVIQGHNGSSPLGGAGEPFAPTWRCDVLFANTRPDRRGDA